MILAAKSAIMNTDGSREHCALLMDEMMITNGIMYSISRNRVFGLAEIAAHGIKTEIYTEFYGMKYDSPHSENLSNMKYFDNTAEKLKGHSACTSHSPTGRSRC